MRRSIALYGATEEALALVPLIEANPEIEIAGIFDPDAEGARARLAAHGPALAARLASRVTANAQLLAGPLHAVIDAGALPPFAAAHPDAARRGVQILSPLTARLLFGYGVSARDRKAELLQALHEVVDSVNLTIDADELFARMLEIAMGVTGADGGSVMLLDAESGLLSIRVAIGVEPELWPKIRVAVGEGIAGRVAAEARPLKLRGKADREHFRVVRERLDVESALCVPLSHGGQVLGVLNLHHSTRPDAFDDDDLAFAEQLGRLDAEIIARAQEHERLRSQATRYAAVREVRRVLSGPSPLLERLGALCRLLAEKLGAGIATLYLYDADDRELRLAATSLSGGGFGGEYRIAQGQGVDGGAARTREPAFLRGVDGILTYAALPLLAGHDLVGVLSVQSGSDATALGGRGRALEETLLEVAAAAADEIAQAEREARMSARATKASAINESGIRMVSARDLGEVARLATSSAALILEADHAILRLQDAETKRYVIRSYYGSADGRTQERLFRLDKQMSVDAIKARAPRLVRHVGQDPGYAPLDAGVQSAMAAPLKREGRVIGTLSLYDKVAPDQFYAGSFHDDDLQIFTKYVSYVERAIDAALLWTQARQQRNFDEETGLPNAEYLARRIDQEIARAAGRENGLAVVACRIDNLDEIRRSGDPLRAERLLLRTAEAVRAHLRDFDVLARSGDGEFSVLMPDPGAEPEERITAFARAVADEVAKDDRLNQPLRVALSFGYAIHPAEGRDRATLLARTGTARIRML
jgi:diguanylate cyclase (GGDEF)-like protein